MLTGVLHPTAGQGLVLGLVPWEQRRTLAGRIGSLFGQRSQLWADLPARTSLGVLGAIHGLEDDSLPGRIDELAELFDAGAVFDRPLSTLSLGQRMRCELAACVLHRPEILFLDEPTIGLDLLAKQRFRQLLVQLNTELGTTVFLTSHDVADIEQVADRVVVVNHGQILHDASVAVLRRTLLAVKRIEVGLTEPVDPTILAAVDASLGPSVAMEQPTLHAVHFELDTTACAVRDVLDQVLDALPVADVSVVDPPLERVIGAIYEEPV
jgi:ABC-2 type transport system ATP-binding protein